MKRVRLILLCLSLLPAVVVAQVVVRQEPLTWEKTARLPGDQLYGNLCAACHDADGSGDGAACEALGIAAPDLTGIAARNGGVFPHKQVGRVIADRSHYGAHARSAMPAWENQFKYFRPGLSAFAREAYARNRIHELTAYLASLQASN